jgi:hypothetical protein
VHVDDFREMQRAGAMPCLSSLFDACRRKFLNAANLLEVRSPAIERLRSVGVETRIDLWPMLNPFMVLAERYVAAFFSPQAALFPAPGGKEDERWSRYFHQVLLPHMLQQDELVRNVLRAVRALPCNDPPGAASAVGHYFAEMTLPETSPAWVPEAISEN